MPHESELAIVIHEDIVKYLTLQLRGHGATTEDVICYLASKTSESNLETVSAVKRDPFAIVWIE